MATSKLTVESLLEDVGGCGSFQVLMVIMVHSPTFVAAWGILFMAFGNFNPGWQCDDPAHNLSSPFDDIDADAASNASMDDMKSCKAYERCQHIVFNNDSSTIVTEWNLACNKTWIISLMISLEMGGQLLGVLFIGHLNNYIGRKACLYVILLLHIVFNLIAMFAVNWRMYTVLLFLMGITCGSLNLCAYIYPVEFLTSKWRGPFGALPTTNTGNLAFALLAMYLRDWRKLHLASIILATVLLVPIFWVPESLRWLTIKGNVCKAQKVVRKIAKVNRTRIPDSQIINTVANHEINREEKRPVYTIIDLYRHGYLLMTLVVTFVWVCFQLIFSVILYGVKNLSGDFYINLCIAAFITSAAYPFAPLLSNTVGRRCGIFIFLILSVICCIGLITQHFLDLDVDRGLVTTALSLALLSCIDGAWIIAIVYTVELYPTVLRSLSYSHASCLSNIGGIIAPFLIPDEQRSAMTSYVTMGVLTLIACISIFVLPETRGQHMADVIERDYERNENEAQV